jgi:NhaA family Na+:H+ antiporter
MVFSFGIATQEITKACLPDGVLNLMKKALNPLINTFGGVIGPICVYVLFVRITGNTALVRGWAIPTATDIALAWLVARFAFGEGHPAIAFLLLLAIVDDGIGLAIIAIFYPDPSTPVQPIFLLFVILGMLLSYLFRIRQVRLFWPYILIGGTLAWFGLHLAHLHPALALVFIIPFLPVNLLNGFQDFFKKPVDMGLLGFGLVNAGVPFSSVGSATWAVLLSLVIGKTVGVTLFSMIASSLGFPLPTGMTNKALIVVAMTAAIGMTVALFVAGVAFIDIPTQQAAKMGALMSSGMIIPVLIVAKIFKVTRLLARSSGR